MVNVYITKGLPASGKTTWAKELVSSAPNSYKRVNKDDLREMMDCSIHSNSAESFVIAVRDMIIMEAIKRGKHVIVDDTNLNPTHEAHIRNMVHGEANVVIQDFTDIEPEECVKRDLRRNRSVGKDVIMKMYNKYLKRAVSPIIHIGGLQDVVICDLDGTLSLLNGRDPYDASTCENDTLNDVVYSLIKDKSVILVSGREEKYRENTLSFLNKHGVKYIHLYMRATGDFRKDYIVKQEIFDTHIRGKYNVIFVLDDRDRIVKMWRDNGLTCLQVADGDF